MEIRVPHLSFDPTLPALAGVIAALARRSSPSLLGAFGPGVSHYTANRSLSSGSGRVLLASLASVVLLLAVCGGVHATTRYQEFLEGNNIEENTDRPGGDYRSFYQPSGTDYSVCLDTCAKESRCLAYTWVKAGIQSPNQSHCWLKSIISAPKRSDCCKSGVVRGIAKARAGDPVKILKPKP